MSYNYVVGYSNASTDYKWQVPIATVADSRVAVRTGWKMQNQNSVVNSVKIYNIPQKYIIIFLLNKIAILLSDWYYICKTLPPSFITSLINSALCGKIINWFINQALSFLKLNNHKKNNYFSFCSIERLICSKCCKPC